MCQPELHPCAGLGLRADHLGGRSPSGLTATAPLARRDALTKALREAFAPEELHLTGLHTGLHLLAELRDPPPDDALRAAAEAEGVRLSLLSDYDLTGGGATLGGTLVLGYGSLADESCASVGETLKRVCTAAWESSVRV